MEKRQLVEIKKGNTGTGLLLENDGYMSLDMAENKVLRESIDDFKNGEVYELPRPFVVSAVLQKYGVKNANGRIYPENILKREVINLQEKVKQRAVLCELEHPEDANINLERVCALVIEMHWVNHTLVGKIEIPVSEGFRRYGVCSTLADRVALWLINDLRVGISSRALGSVEQVAGALVVGSDLELVTFDLVSTNSTPGAILKNTEEELQPFIESKENDDKPIIKEDKFSKFDKWLKD